MIEQLSDEWFAARLGKITSSRVKDVMAKGRGGAVSASRKNYMMELLCQRLTGQREEGFTSTEMQRGTDLEPLARAAYEVNHDALVTEAEFILHPDYEFTGSSPDGYVGESGLIEIKCNIRCFAPAGNGAILRASMTVYQNPCNCSYPGSIGMTIR